MKIPFKYRLFYVPNRVIEKFNENLDVKLKAPVIKRKLSAMIYSTIRTKELVYKNIYIHKFGTIIIYVNHSTQIIRNVEYNDTRVENCDFRMYRKLCNRYELNADRDDFVAMKKCHIYGKNNFYSVQHQINKNPNHIFYSDDDTKTWHKLIDDIKYYEGFDVNDGFSMIKSERVNWVYALR